jgi:tryptophan synthase beta chain
VAEAIRRAPDAKDQVFLIKLSGRGDKDMDIYRQNLKDLDRD